MRPYEEFLPDFYGMALKDTEHRGRRHEAEDGEEEPAFLPRMLSDYNRIDRCVKLL